MRARGARRAALAAAITLLAAVGAAPAGGRPARETHAVAQGRIDHASPPPRLTNFKLRWAHQTRSARALAALSAFPGGTAVVGLAPHVSADALAGYGVAVRMHDEKIRAVEVEGTASELRALANAVGVDARLRYVEPVRRLTLAHQRSDPATTTFDPATGLPYEWAFGHVGLDRALNLSRGSADILVGIVDTGYAPVPDLAGKVAHSWYYTAQGTDANDVHGHGTFVASILAGVNDDGLGVGGYCGACRLDVFRDVWLWDITVAQAIRRLADDNVRIINLSLGFPDGMSYVVADALNYAIAKGVLVVASAGNDGIGTVSFPASWLQPANGGPSYGLAVGASDQNDSRVWFSNWGTNLSLTAPGGFSGDCHYGIYGALSPSALLFNDPCTLRSLESNGAIHAYSQGTSFSAPEVAGVAALVWAARPELKSYEVAAIIKESATRPAGTGWTPDRGWGVLNAARALELATGRSSADQLSIEGLTFEQAPRAGKRVTLDVSVRWQDGLPAGHGVVRCEATAGGRRIASVGGEFTDGEGLCGWRLPLWTAKKRMSVRVTASDASGPGAARAFASSIRKR